MKFKRIMMAAVSSGSGKTTLTCALLQALKDSGQQVVSFKCGPDYIDPMFHEKVMGIPSRNLDTFFTGEAGTRALFLKNRTPQDFAVLEGVMGLYDGLGGIREEGSSYHLAKVTKTPIILVVDAKGMGYSLIPLLAGFLAYDTEKLIKGVILNRMSGGFYKTMKPLIEQQLGISVLGFFPENQQFHVESRHLGLMIPDELQNIKEKLKAMAAEVRQTVSMDRISQIAKDAQPLEAIEQTGLTGTDTHPVIAVAKDEAFCFYYEDNLTMLKEYGAQIRYFSPLHDKCMPEEASGLLLGGGYPELYAAQLSENRTMLASIRHAVSSGLPVVAECGGFMYLHDKLFDKDQKGYTMVGVIPHTCRYAGKLVRFGYIELEEEKSHFLPEGQRIKGHEFHYFDSEENGCDCRAVKPVTGKSYPCVMSGETYWMGFPHLYYPSNPSFAGKFVEKAGDYRDQKGR